MSKSFILICASSLALAVGGFAAIMTEERALILPGAISIMSGVVLFLVYVLAHWIYSEGIQPVLYHLRIHLLVGSVLGVVLPSLHGGGIGRVLFGLTTGLLVAAFVGYLHRPKPDTSDPSAYDGPIAADEEPPVTGGRLNDLS